MIKPSELFALFIKNEWTFFTGVPDSLLKDFCAYIADNAAEYNHIIAANEGNAIALASGYHLATKKVGVVYLQNSGLGNCINPLVSLADKEVYSIPVLLVVGWRGQPGIKDEPQHAKQGKITLLLLETLGIPYTLLPKSICEAESALHKVALHFKNDKSPYAIVVEENTFEEYALQNTLRNTLQKIKTHKFLKTAETLKNAETCLNASVDASTNSHLNREQALQCVIELLENEDIVVSTTGKISRELFELRKTLKTKHNFKAGHEADFLTVGSMGHASSIALGIALQKPKRIVYCLDGDGALLMHAGSLAVIGHLHQENFRHILFNNQAHDSVGGQPTAAESVDFLKIAEASGYRNAFSAESETQLKEKMLLLKKMPGPTFLEIKICKGARKNLGRPTRTPLENKNEFMDFLKQP